MSVLSSIGPFSKAKDLLSEVVKNTHISLYLCILVFLERCRLIFKELYSFFPSTNTFIGVKCLFET